MLYSKFGNRGNILSYGKRLKEFRKSIGLSQQDFASSIGFQLYKIRDIEVERLQLTPEIAELIQKKYSLNGWWLLTGEGEMFSKTGEAVQHQSGSGDLGDQNSLTNFDLWQVNGGVGIGGNTNTLNLKYRDNYVKLEQLAVMGGIEGAEAPIKGLEKLKDELKQYI